ncbi:hypothetical protein AAE478_009396 [Parahypoxylon ruwenzoriense]
MAGETIFRFFDLPAELRRAILTQLLVLDCIVLPKQTFSPPGPLNVFLVNMQMYQEASAIFYSQNDFTLNVRAHRLPMHLTTQGGFLSQEGRDARRRVRNLTLRLTRVGRDFKDVVGPALSDMVLCGSLRVLNVRLGSSSRMPPEFASQMVPLDPVHDPDFMRWPPFQALLKLLADPYLEVAKFEISRGHSSVYCPFHEEECSPAIWATGWGDDEDEDGMPIRPDFFELDWKAMIKVSGIEQQIASTGEKASTWEFGIFSRVTANSFQKPSSPA